MEKVIKWWKTTNTFFSETYMPQDNDKFTNGEVVITHIGIIAALLIIGLI